MLTVLTKKLLPLSLIGFSLSGCALPEAPAADKQLLQNPASASAFITVAESKELDVIAPRKLYTGQRAGIKPKVPTLNSTRAVIPTARYIGHTFGHTGASVANKIAVSPDAGKAVTRTNAGATGDTESFAVLAYHRVASDSSRYTVSPEAFSEQMRYLYINGYHTLTTGELEDYFRGESLPAKSVLITIDDGHRSAFEQIHKVLQQYGFRALYFPYSDFINNGGLSSSMMRTMLETGLVEFGLHSKTHAALTEQVELETDKEYQERILFELVEPATKIRRITGEAATSIAYPYGKINRRVESWVRAQGVALGFTVNCALNNRKINRLRINRCTIWNSDDQNMFAAKLEEPRVALARIASGESAVRKSAPPEFLGHLADREFFKGIPIEPFVAYFVDPEGEQLRYAATSLPQGLNIDTTTGEVSGTPESSARVSEVVIQAIDETGSVARSNAFNMIVY